MRPVPALRVHVRRFDVWHRGVAGLTTAVAIALVAWAISRDGSSALFAVAALAVAVYLAHSLMPAASCHLHFDGEAWHLRTDPPSHTGGRPGTGRAVQGRRGPGKPAPSPAFLQEERESTGKMIIRLDLGAWMLLEFVPERREGSRWLPIQRTGLERDWHALRCALHARGAP